VSSQCSPFDPKNLSIQLSFIEIAIHGVNYVFLGRKNCIFDLVDRNPEAASNGSAVNEGLSGRLSQILASIVEKSRRIKDFLGIAFVSHNEKFWVGMDFKTGLFGHERRRGKSSNFKCSELRSMQYLKRK